MLSVVYLLVIIFSPQSSSHTWQKVDYLLEFSEWLYAHQYPVQDALSHLQWGLTLLQQLLQSGIEEGEGGEEDGEKEGGEIVGKEGGETGGEVEGTKGVCVRELLQNYCPLQ